MRQAPWGTFLICGSSGSWADPAFSARLSLDLESAAMTARARGMGAIQGSFPKMPVWALKSQKPVQGCGPKLIQTWATTVLAGHFQLEKSLQWHWSGLKLSTPQKQHMKQQRPQRDVRLCSGEMPAALPQPSGKTCGHLYMSQNHSQAHMQDTQSHDCSLRREMITRHLTWTKIFLLLILNLPSPSSSEQFAAFAFILKGSDPSLLGGRRPLGFTSLCNVLKLLVLCFKAWLDLRACRSISLLAV